MGECFNTRARFRAQLLHYVTVGEFKRACRLRDWMERRNWPVPVIGFDDESLGLALMGVAYDLFKSRGGR